MILQYPLYFMRILRIFLVIGIGSYLELVT